MEKFSLSQWLGSVLCAIIIYLWAGNTVTLSTVFGFMIGCAIACAIWNGIQKLNDLFKNMLWKRFSWFRHKCEICNKRSFIQYEVGLGYWVCKKKECAKHAATLAEEDLEEWQNNVLTSSNNMV